RHGRVVLSRQPPSNNTRPPSSNTRRLRTVRGLRSVLLVVLLVLVAVLLVIVGLVVLGVFLLLLALGHADDDERIRRFRLGRLRVLGDVLALGHIIVEDLVLADAEPAYGPRRIGGVGSTPLDSRHSDAWHGIGVDE